MANEGSPTTNIRIRWWLASCTRRGQPKISIGIHSCLGIRMTSSTWGRRAVEKYRITITYPDPKKNEEKTSLQPLRDQFDEAPAIQNKSASLKSEIQLQNLGKKKILKICKIQVEIPTWSEKIQPFSPTLCVFVRQKCHFTLEHLGWFSLQYLGPGESACVFLSVFMVPKWIQFRGEGSSCVEFVWTL